MPMPLDLPLQPGPCRINAQGYAAIQNGLCVSWSAGVYCGVVCVEVQGEGWPSGCRQLCRQLSGV